MNIGVYSPNWIGDAVMALPFFRELKNRHPEAEINVFCKNWVSAVYQNNPSLSEIISVPDDKINGFFNTINIGHELKQKKFDLTYTLTDSMRSAFILWLSGAPKRFGYKSQMRSFLLTKAISQPNQIVHRSEKYLGMLKLIDKVKIKPKIYISDDEKEWAETEMKKYQLNAPVALSPFSISSARTIPNHLLKKWIENSKKDYLVFGSKFDFEKSNKLIKSCKNISIKSICGKYSLRQSIALIYFCDYALATDTGLGHISAALGVPTISFFGAGISSITAPIGDRSNLIKHCYPCKGEFCEKSDDGVLCIKRISKSDVEIAVRNLLLNP